MFRIILTATYLLLLSACTTTHLPSHVAGQFPAEKPPIQQFYAGEQLPQEQIALLVTGHNKDQTYLYITQVNDVKANKHGIIGGARAANVEPGSHRLELQFHDKHRLIMPLVLEGVDVEKNTGYLVNFSADYPQGYEDKQIELNSKLAIKINVSNLDTRDVIRDVTFNGWGKIIENKK